MKTIKNLIHIISLIFLVSVITISNSNIHLKTLYQTFFNLLILVSICFFILKYRFRSEFKFEGRFYYWLFYWIVVSSFINSLAENYYKLGRYYFDIDFFRFIPSLIPLYFYYNYRSFVAKERSFVGFQWFVIISLSSISYSFLYTEFPEISILFFYPIAVEFLNSYNKNRFKFNNLVLFSFCSLFLITILFGYSSQHYLSYLFLFILLYSFFYLEFDLNFGFLIILFLFNCLEVILRSYYLNEGLTLLNKDGSSILNSNRVSAYVAIHIPVILLLIDLKIRKLLKVTLVFVLLLSILLLFNQVSRSSLFGVIIVLISYFLSKRIKKKWFLIYLFSISILVLVIHFIPLLSIWIAPQIYNEYSFLNELSSGRLELWKLFYQIFSQLSMKEKIFGLGIGEHNFLLAYLPLDVSPLIEQFTTKADGAYLHTHNLPSTLLFYSGYIGLVFYLILLGFLFIRNIKLLNKDQVEIFPTLALLYFLIHNSFDMLVDVYGFMFIFILLLKNIDHSKDIGRDENPNHDYSISKNKIILISLGFIFYSYFLYSRLYFKREFFEINNFINQNFDTNRNCNLVRYPNKTVNGLRELEGLNSSSLLIGDFPSYRYTQERFLFQLLKLKQENVTSDFENKLNQLVLECKKQHFRPIICEINHSDIVVSISDKWISRVIDECRLR
ncbi:hypothetical protein CH368_06585 [Leptospira levettii]|nr:hypothetical protein CH368_06585 [Leptospira levettii]